MNNIIDTTSPFVLAYLDYCKVVLGIKKIEETQRWEFVWEFANKWEDAGGDLRKVNGMDLALMLGKKI